MTPALLFLLGCGAPPAPQPAPDANTALSPPEAAVWPQRGATLEPQSAEFPPDFGVKRIYIDAGHGAGDNHGNMGVRCVYEEEHTLEIAQMLEAALDAHPSFEATVCRDPETRPSYTKRVEAAAAWKADVFLSIHSDSRADAVDFTWPDGRTCLRNDTDPGFAVLWSPEGPLSESRHTLAQNIAKRLTAAGFPAYDGSDYGTRYVLDANVPGVFEDRRKLLVLRRPVMKSIIIETHHALDLLEVERWDEDETREVFVSVVIAALADSP